MRMVNVDDTFVLTSFQALPAGRRQRAGLGLGGPPDMAPRLAGKMPTPHNKLGGGRLARFVAVARRLNGMISPSRGWVQ